LECALEQHRHLPHSRFVSLATVRADGRPANRTVTFRLFINDDRLLFTSDIRSEKISELRAQPWAELCWYFSESRQQFRLSGEIEVSTISDDPALSSTRHQIWQERPEQFRQSFTWPAPGQMRSTDAAFQLAAPTAPHDNFAIMLLRPRSVEMLDLRPVPFERRLFRSKSGNWSEALLNP
jgi:pyridoxamine 5'-phosphate oxidase